MSESIDLLIVDYRIEGFNRYAVGLCHEIHKIQPEIKIAACYMKDAAAKEINGFSKVFCAKDYNYDASKILEKYRPKAVLTFAHRFFDYLFTITAHEKGLYVYNFQHGLYMDSTVISDLSANSLVSVYKNKKEKLDIYLKCSLNLCKHRFKAICKFTSLFLKKKSLYVVMNEMFDSQCNADISYIYGGYWKTYYTQRYLETASEYLVVGYPELEGNVEVISPELFRERKKPVLCYLAQTSVEDGVLDEVVMTTFIERLKKLVVNYNLLIKFHPRSNRAMYASLLAKEGVAVWDKNTFPKADLYIGHESTIMARALSITSKTLVCRLLANRISPFEIYTPYLIMPEENLSDSVAVALDATETKSNISEYAFWNKAEGAIAATAQDMMCRYSKYAISNNNI